MEREQELEQACDIAYKAAGDNAYFEIGFRRGAQWEADRDKWISVEDRMPEYIESFLRSDSDEWTPEQTFDLICLTEMGDLWKNRRVKMQVGNKEWVWLTNLTEDTITHFKLFTPAAPKTQ